MKKTKVITILSSILAMCPATAVAGDLSVSTSVDYATEYVFRGVSYQRGAAQPGIEASKDGFTLGVWSSLAMGETSSASIDEIDVYGGYAWGLSDTISADVGFTIYHFPDTPGSLFDFGGASTFETYAGLSFDTALSPSIYGYYDFDLEAFTVIGSAEHIVDLAPKTTLDLGATVGVIMADGGGDYEYGLGSAAISYAVNEAVSAYVGANYSLSSEDTLRFKVDGFGNGFTNSDNLLWLGAGVATSF